MVPSTNARDNDQAAAGDLCAVAIMIVDAS